MYTKKGDPQSLKREQEGYKWFGVKAEIKDNTIIVPRFKGKPFPQYNGVSGNEEWIEKLVHFYCVKFRGTKLPVHGDLCLCNVIFGKEIHIIDWEHFHWADPKNFGFDIINMLFIHLHYEHRWLHRFGINWASLLNAETRQFVTRMLWLLGESTFTSLPFTNSRHYINKYMDKKKFLLARVNNELVESLDLLWFQ